jgi:hypothetical protein
LQLNRDSSLTEVALTVTHLLEKNLVTHIDYIYLVLLVDPLYNLLLVLLLRLKVTICNFCKLVFTSRRCYNIDVMHKTY